MILQKFSFFPKIQVRIANIWQGIPLQIVHHWKEHIQVYKSVKYQSGIFFLNIFSIFFLKLLLTQSWIHEVCARCGHHGNHEWLVLWFKLIIQKYITYCNNNVKKHFTYMIWIGPWSAFPSQVQACTASQLTLGEHQ